MNLIRTSSLAAVLALCACAGQDSSGPPPPGGLNPCGASTTPSVITLPVGGVAVVNDQSAIGCAELQTSGGEAGTFLVVAANANTAPDSIPDFVLADSSASGDVLASVLGNVAPIQSSQATLVASTPQLEARASVGAEARLRAMERRVLRLGESASMSGASALLRSTGTLGGVSEAAAPSVGDTLTYKVPDPNAANACTDFTSVKAVVKAVGQHGILAQDVNAPSGGFTSSDFSAISNEFDDIIYTTDTVHFGNPSDIDGNNRVVLLYTPVVNAATKRNSQSVTQGFFFGGDLFPTSQCAQSNRAEVFYLIVPDPNAKFSDARTSADVRENTRGTIAHEFQHMINLSVRIRVNAPDEDTWLNEGLSHLAEEIVGRAERGFSDEKELNIDDVANQTADPQLKDFNAFFGQNLVRFRNWLRKPGELGATSTHADTSLAVRGASWALLRWSADHYDSGNLPAFTRALVAGPQTGVANLTARAGVPFDSLMAGWMVANFADNGAVPGLANRYTYTSWNIRNVEAAVNNGPDVANPGEFPLVPKQLPADQSATGTAPSAGGSYFLLSTSAQGRTLIGELDPAGGTVTYTGARLYILRLQ